MPAIKIPRANFKIRYSGDPSDAGRRNVPSFVKSDSAIAGSNFMFYDLPSGNLIGQLIIDGTKKNGGTGKNLDAVSLSSNGSVVFHDESTASNQASSLVWSMAAGPIIVLGGKFSDVTWSKYTKSQLEPTIGRQRTCLGVDASGDFVLAYRDSINLTDLAGYMKSLGCTDVITGDGGSSAQLYLEATNKLYGTDVRSVHVIPVALTAYTVVSTLA
ncbi:phosphodiester glycosidase family protein [Deinococcus sp.]|uniref:phosphodiester glycosidase family protein n=1 Tax=Deinococcus sp. TaxID=47478 RepID=UPI0025D43BEA|nr:phosphodiester glycosidase family protein [Deinococcus sp.]